MAKKQTSTNNRVTGTNVITKLTSGSASPLMKKNKRAKTSANKEKKKGIGRGKDKKNERGEKRKEMKKEKEAEKGKDKRQAPTKDSFIVKDQNDSFFPSNEGSEGEVYQPSKLSCPSNPLSLSSFSDYDEVRAFVILLQFNYFCLCPLLIDCSSLFFESFKKKTNQTARMHKAWRSRRIRVSGTRRPAQKRSQSMQ